MSESNVNPQKPEFDDRSAKKKARSHRFWFWVAVLFFVWWFNNYTLKTTKVQLTSDKLVSPIRIAVISDQHASKYGISNDSIFRKIDKAKPDMVAVLGDMYSRGSEWELVSKPVELIRELTDSGYTVYFVTGDHDYYGESVISKRYIEAVKNTGAHVLDYKCEYAELNGNRVQIIGIDNVVYSPTFDLTNEFAVDRGCYSILLAHIPNYEDFAQFGTDLTLCADTHGDMIQLPFDLGPVYDASRNHWFPQITSPDETVYDKGIFEYSGGNMFITSGIGASPVPIRFNNRPEVVIMDIEPK